LEHFDPFTEPLLDETRLGIKEFMSPAYEKTGKCSALVRSIDPEQQFIDFSFSSPYVVNGLSAEFLCLPSLIKPQLLRASNSKNPESAISSSRNVVQQ
jgi:hypothetical protein